MKKIILVALTILCTNLFSQATYTDQAGRWRLGLNAGAMWQTSDVTAHANIAGGFTIEKILNKKADAWIGFALGFRYLSGHCTGIDTKASYGVASNTALNGSFNTQTDYAHNGGIFYNNYKTYIHEGALELKVNFPKFEQKTNLIFHLMGGVGVCNYKTWINALDANGNRYDFTALQNAQSVTAADVKKVMNGTYSTLAQGSAPGGTYRFTPSAGVGFGFKLSRVVSLVFEYRVAFQRTNLLDGVDHTINNVPIKNNDFYHYVSANLLFSIYGRSNQSSYAHAPVTSNTGYTNANNQTQTVYNQAPVYNNNQPVYENQSQPQYNAPTVTITSPQSNFSSPGDFVSLQAVIQNIQSAQQLNISQNGHPVKYFTYNASTGNLSFQTFLQQGTNNIIVTANNSSGTGSGIVTIFYNPPYTPANNNEATAVITNPPVANTPVGMVKKPLVQYINPHVSPEDVTLSTFNISASVSNINLANQVTVHVNGSVFTQFTYNQAKKTVNFTLTLTPGYNSINITASNVSGTDSKSTVIDYKPAGRAPNVVIFNPATNPFTSTNQHMLVSGYVYNVASAAEIMVNFDGSQITFNYNIATHEIEIPVNLSHNSNQLQITANNTFGSDIKQQTLLFLNLSPVNSEIIPVKPTETPATFTVNPHVGNSFTAPTQNPPVQTFTLNPHQQVGGGTTYNEVNNTTATGTSNGASAHHNKPEFLLTSPGTNPYTSLSGAISVSANLNFAPDVNLVSVKYNGAPVSFSYNPIISEHFSFTSPLKPGSNVFVISATNAFGSISQNVEVNYIPTNPNGNVNGNPALHFSDGTNANTNVPRSVPRNINVTPISESQQQNVQPPANTLQMQQPGAVRSTIKPR